MKPANSKVACLFLVIAWTSTSCSADSVLYSVYIANYGANGVILLDFPSEHLYHKEIRDRWNIGPGIPGVDLQRFGAFKDYPESIPDFLEIKWQLAKLSECDHEISSKSLPPYEDYDSLIHTRKYGCHWEPISGETFTKRIDLRAVRDTVAYRNAGKPYKGNPLNGSHTLGIHLVFSEKRLELEVTSGKTMGIMQ